MVRVIKCGTTVLLADGKYSSFTASSSYTPFPRRDIKVSNLLLNQKGVLKIGKWPNVQVQTIS